MTGNQGEIARVIRVQGPSCLAGENMTIPRDGSELGLRLVYVVQNDKDPSPEVCLVTRKGKKQKFIPPGAKKHLGDRK